MHPFIIIDDEICVLFWWFYIFPVSSLYKCDIEEDIIWWFIFLPAWARFVPLQKSLINRRAILFTEESSIKILTSLSSRKRGSWRPKSPSRIIKSTGFTIFQGFLWLFSCRVIPKIILRNLDFVHFEHLNMFDEEVCFECFYVSKILNFLPSNSTSRLSGKRSAG